MTLVNCACSKGYQHLEHGMKKSQVLATQRTVDLANICQHSDIRKGMENHSRCRTGKKYSWPRSAPWAGWTGAGRARLRMVGSCQRLKSALPWLLYLSEKRACDTLPKRGHWLSVHGATCCLFGLCTGREFSRACTYGFCVSMAVL